MILVGIGLAGCGGGGDAGLDSKEPGAVPTYYEDVAPILQEHCVSCHSEGNIAPMTLLSFEDARTMAPLIATQTQSRKMPPYHVDASGACNEWRDARVLGDGEIATLAAWAAGGQPMGDPSKAPPPAEPPNGLEQVDATLDAAIEYAPDTSLDDDYRCFVVDPGIGADAFLTAYEVRPGQAGEVHHVVAWALDTPADEATVASLDDAEPGPGYTCFGGPGAAAPRTLLGWAPGSTVTRYPEGTGLRLLAGRKVVMQVHYNLSGGAAPDRTRVDLALAGHVDHEALITGVGDFDLNLPPGMAHVEERQASPFSPLAANVKVHGVFPHMHTLGRSLHVEVQQTNGATTCLVDVPDYSFAWQQFYFYKEPITMAFGETGQFDIRCGYDTRGATHVVHFGEGTGDEMCLSGFYVTY